MAIFLPKNSILKKIEIFSRKKMKIFSLLTLVIGAFLVIFISAELFDEITGASGESIESYEEISSTKNKVKNESVTFLNFGKDRSEWRKKYRLQYLENPERVLQSKVNVLARLLKIHVDHLRDKTEQVSDFY